VRQARHARRLGRRTIEPWCGSETAVEKPPSPRRPPAARIVHRTRGSFGEIVVVDENGLRHLRFPGIEGVDQSVVVPRRPGELPTAYLRAATLGAVLAPRLERVLLVGLGGGAFARFLRRHFRRASIDVVEVDPVVVRLARRFFGFREDARLELHVEDAQSFVKAARARLPYDFVFLDAYAGAKVPRALASRAFFQRVASLVATGGLVAANVGHPERRTEESFLRKFAAAFPGGSFVVPVPAEDNRVVFGARDPLPRRTKLLAQAACMDETGRLPFSLAPLLRRQKPIPRTAS